MGQIRFEDEGEGRDRRTVNERIREMLETADNELDCLHEGVDEAVRLGIFKIEDMPNAARLMWCAQIERVARTMTEKGGVPTWIPTGKTGHRIVRIDWAKTSARAKNVLVRARQLVGGYKKAWSSRLDMVTRGEEDQCPPVPEFKDGWREIAAQLEMFEVAEDEDGPESDESADAQG